ncbi:hypothetical protein CYMTET_49516 [Cymbomonas tetramitiformis]|uniref:Uncharacterized protein n=1 Tax=Cymbomonas tetramitiformis TaxID=36881 RepID=A0AAE0EUM1_9CHLO|nr:hypothetical protein CYMTET_49516 [Cymbomonas tetramitiformis]
MSAIPIRSKDGAISLYDILAHICRTDVKTATKRLNNILSGGHTHVPTIRSIIETKTAYTIFPDTINFRPTPVITSTSQGHSVLEEFTSIFNKSARYNKIQALTQQAHLLTFTTDTYPGLCSFLHPSTTTDTPPIALPAPAFLNPTTTSTACGCTASFAITPLKPKTDDPTTQKVKVQAVLAHTGHSPGTATDLASLNLLPEVYNELVQICRLHNKSSFQIKRAHTHFLKGFVPTLGLAYADLDKDVDHRFFPFPSDIKNAINEAARASRHAQVDQESTLLYLAAEAETEKFSWAFRSDGQQALTYTYDDSAHTLGCNVFSITEGVKLPFPKAPTLACKLPYEAYLLAKLYINRILFISSGGHRFLESSQEVLTTGGLREVIQPLVPDILSRTPPPPPFLRIEQPSTDLCLPESHPSVSEMQEIVKHLIQPLPHFASKEFLVIDLDQFTTSLTAPFLPTNPLHLPFHQQKCLFAFVHEPAGEWRLFVLDGEVSHTVYVFDPSGPRHIPPYVLDSLRGVTAEFDHSWTVQPLAFSMDIHNYNSALWCVEVVCTATAVSEAQASQFYDLLPYVLTETFKAKSIHNITPDLSIDKVHSGLERNAAYIGLPLPVQL